MFKHVEKEAADRAKPWQLSLSLIGGMVLLIGVALLVWSLLLRSPTRPSAPSVQYSPPQPPLALSVAYEDAVKQSLAQQRHVSVLQTTQEALTSKLGVGGVPKSQGLL